MPLRLVLVRHGLSTFNTEHRIQGRDDLSSLTEEGRLQARRTGEALREVTLDAAFTSPLRRARDTAGALLEAQGAGLDATPCDGLLEIDLAPWSGLLRQELKEHFPRRNASGGRPPRPWNWNGPTAAATARCPS